MYYGHTTPPTDPLESFTPDAGDNSFEAENNLDLTNQAKEWDQLNEPIEHDKQSLGNAAMNNPIELSMPPSTPEQSAAASNFGKVTNLEDLEPHKIAASEIAEDAISLNENITKITNPSAFREEKGRIPYHAVLEVEHSIENFETPSEVPDKRWEFVKKYMDNSFGEDSPLHGYKEAA